MVHDDPSELLAADLLLGPLVELSLDLDDDVVDGLNAERPLLARLQDGAAELLAVEGLAPPVPLDHVRQDILDVLVGRVPTVALEALTAAPDELPVPAHPRVDDPILRVTAKRALHRAPTRDQSIATFDERRGERRRVLHDLLLIIAPGRRESFTERHGLAGDHVHEGTALDSGHDGLVERRRVLRPAHDHPAARAAQRL